MPSPATVKDVHFKFPPSPDSSPKLGRPRSSTLGALPDPILAQKFKELGHLEKVGDGADFQDHARRRASTNSPMKNSPMKQMYDVYIAIHKHLRLNFVETKVCNVKG